MKSFHIELLNYKHDRDNFDCGEPILNNYLKHFANQHAKNRISKTFVATHSEKIAGYYTLSAGNINFEMLPPEWQKKFPRYPITIARLARLAVDKFFQQKGLGKHLLMDSLFRCINLSTEIGMMGVVVDAKNAKAKNFYEQFGFTELSSSTLTLFIPLSTIEESIK